MKSMRLMPVLLILWLLLLVCLPALVGAACAPQPVNLISWWKGDGNAMDTTGLNNGALMNGTGFASGMVGQAFSFDGVNDYVNVPNSASLDPTAAASLVAWVYFDQLPSAAGHIMQIAAKSGSGTDLDLQAQTDNRVYFYVAGGRSVQSSTVVQTGRWYHIVGTYTASNQLKMYVNGVLESTVSIVGTTRGTNNNPFTIGQSAIWSGRFFKGRIDEVSLFNRALDVSEIQSIYNAGGAGICAEPDLLWYHPPTGNIYVWYMDGATQLGGASLGTVADTRWQLVGAGDFNGDGKADLLWYHPNGSVYVWYMDGATQLGGALLGTVSDPRWQLVGAGDFNGDGKPDLLWYHPNGSVYVWFMNGATQIGGALLGTVSDPRWQVVAVGDFNGDGKPDLLWYHPPTGNIYVWYMDGATQIGGASLGTVADTRWQLVRAGDFNGDGKPDLLWYHPNGSVYVWFMNGGTQIGGALLGTVSDPRWQPIK